MAQTYVHNTKNSIISRRNTQHRFKYEDDCRRNTLRKVDRFEVKEVNPCETGKPYVQYYSDKAQRIIRMSSEAYADYLTNSSNRRIKAQILN